MRTILVDAVNTFVVEGHIDTKLHALLEKFPNRKIILTNADDEQMATFGLTDLPYELFTLKHSPDKIDPAYFRNMLEKFKLTPNDVVYFEHNEKAVESARSIGIVTHHFDDKERNLNELMDFIQKNV